MTATEQLELERFAYENELSDGAIDDLVEMVGEFCDEAWRRGQLSTLPD